MVKRFFIAFLSLVLSGIIGASYLAGLVVHEYHFYASQTFGLAYVFYMPFILIITLIVKEMIIRISQFEFIAIALSGTTALYLIITFALVYFLLPVDKIVSADNPNYVNFPISCIISLVVYFQFYFRFSKR